ncbi:hypothetical protein TNCV_118501 [Trichonephila clavipes]|nr:hypothetical protein TNCV_118501 [Trichonephila clavipes]
MLDFSSDFKKQPYPAKLPKMAAKKARQMAVPLILLQFPIETSFEYFVLDGSWFETDAKVVVRAIENAKHTNLDGGFLVTDLVILNHGQVTRTTSKLASPYPNCPPMGGRLSYRQNLYRSLVVLV